MVTNDRPFSGRLPDEERYDTLARSGQSEHREALPRLRAAIDVWPVETGDLGEWPEPSEVVAPFEKGMDEWFGTPEGFVAR